MTSNGFSGSIVQVNKEVQFLANHGFTEHSQKEHFGDSVPYVYYASRQTKKLDGVPLWEYVTLVFYFDNGAFLEAVYEAYVAKKNSYAGKGKDEKPAGQKYSKFEKSGQKPVFALLYRDLNELEKKLNE